MLSFIWESSTSWADPVRAEVRDGLLRVAWGTRWLFFNQRITLRLSPAKLEGVTGVLEASECARFPSMVRTSRVEGTLQLHGPAGTRTIAFSPHAVETVHESWWWSVPPGAADAVADMLVSLLEAAGNTRDPLSAHWYRNWHPGFGQVSPRSHEPVWDAECRLGLAMLDSMHNLQTIEWLTSGAVQRRSGHDRPVELGQVTPEDIQRMVATVSAVAEPSPSIESGFRTPEEGCWRYTMTWADRGILRSHHVSYDIEVEMGVALDPFPTVREDETLRSLLRFAQEGR